MKPAIIWALLVIVVVSQYVEGFSILHKILKINENASVDELRVAYEKLLQQWYQASRSLNTEAELLHLKIVQAYRELKIEMEIDFHEKHLLTPEYFKSTVQSLGIEVLHSISVPLTMYNEKLIRDSDESLHLVLFYSASSSRTRIIHNWFNLMEMLTPLGVVMVTINMDNENVDIAKNVIGEYPPSFPYLVLLIDGMVIPYRDDEFIDFMIMDFIRRNIPDDLMPVLTDVSSKKFLSSWHIDNKVRALIFQPSLPPRLQYLLIAFLHRKSFSFGFVNLEDEKSRNTYKKMNVSSEVDTLTVFKEDQELPTVKISMPTIPSKLLNDTLSKNNLLTLPRITSQEMFDMICPVASGFSTHTPLCVILVIRNSLNVRTFDPKITFRKFIQEYSLHFKHVSFMYVYKNYQPGFSLPIKADFQEFDNIAYIVALERVDRHRIKYKILMPEHSNWQDYKSTKERLKMSIEEILTDKHLLFVDPLHLNDFVSEIPPSLSQRILFRLQNYLDKLTLENLLPYFLSLGTAAYFVIYFTSYWNKVQCVWNMIIDADDQKLLKSSEAQMPLQPRKKKECSQEVFMKNDRCITPSRELRLHELKAETYNGMVRLLKPGCRTIILMFDRERADLLVSQFYKAVWPYRKNKNLLFGYLNTEKRATLEWYSELVKACLPEQQDIEINPYFCAGTVLALSGMRKYFCLYHLKHPGIVPSKDKRETSIQTMRSTFTDDELLIGLRDWLDRLFDGSGSVIRYRVNHWPEFKIL